MGLLRDRSPHFSGRNTKLLALNGGFRGLERAMLPTEGGRSRLFGIAPEIDYAKCLHLRSYALGMVVSGGFCSVRGVSRLA
jgi:hypothetical protein